MKKTKYLNKVFGAWKCVSVGIARVQGKRTKTNAVSKQPGRQTYFYIFERPTSDGKASKIVRLSAQQAAKVYRGQLSVEDIVDSRVAKNVEAVATRVSYHFHKK